MRKNGTYYSQFNNIYKISVIKFRNLLLKKKSRDEKNDCKNSHGIEVAANVAKWQISFQNI